MQNEPFTSAKFIEYLQNGMFTFPGGYPMYFITADNCALSFDAAEEQREQIIDAINEPQSNMQWEVVSVDVNWEDTSLYCEHTNKLIPSAYGEETAEEESAEEEN